MIYSPLLLSGPPPRHSSTFANIFSNLEIALVAPSKVSEQESYQEIQGQSQQRDRPHADNFIPPISLLYDGFGVFGDVFNEMGSVPGENDILEVKLWNEVHAFAGQMIKFYDTEAQRQDVLLRSLDRIFRARRDPEGDRISDSKIGSHLITRGAHGAIIFCVECKNELTNISCEPSAKLVSYIAGSFKEEMNGEHQAMFHAWRVPALGMTQIGEWTPRTLGLHFLTRYLGAFVQFFGVVMLAPQIRIVPLTPMLPLAIPIDDERSRRRLFLAFKAASIVISKIQTDVLRLVEKTPPEIPLELRGLPSVTGIKKVGSTSSRIEFALKNRHDTTNPYRNLYHAQLIPTGQGIYVKFTRQYSHELHTFCAERGLAPELLGFEQLPGGWFALAMEKVDTVDLRDIGPLLELDTWKQKIRKLVDDFHQEGLVHGDLRLANFIFTKATPRRMLLVDFDWGGKEKEVYFPRGELAKELRAQDGQHDCLDRPITKEDDNRVFEWTFGLLEGTVTEVAIADEPSLPGETEMEVDPIWYS